MSKSMVATLPFVLLLLDYWPLKRISNFRPSPHNGAAGRFPASDLKHLLMEKIPLFVLAAGACAATALMPGLVIADAHRLPLFERIGNALVSYVVYLWQMVFPVGIGHSLSQCPKRPAAMEGRSGVCGVGGDLRRGVWRGGKSIPAC